MLLLEISGHHYAQNNAHNTLALHSMCVGWRKLFPFILEVSLLLCRFVLEHCQYFARSWCSSRSHIRAVGHLQKHQFQCKSLKLVWQARPNHMVILASWCLAQYSGTATAVQQYSSAAQCAALQHSLAVQQHNSRVAREKQQCISSAAVQYCEHKSMHAVQCRNCTVDYTHTITPTYF
jgi:hypothetical protein